MKVISAVGIDLAKNVFQICAVNQAEKVVFNKKVGRSQLVGEISQIPPTKIFMEACGGSHYWARRFQEFGHEVRLIAGQHVKKFVTGNKSDKIDAEAIVTCGLRPSTKFVPIKTPLQLQEQARHRIRSRLVRERTALCNEMRSILYEQGIFIARTRHALCGEIKSLLRSSQLDQNLKSMMADLYSEYLEKEDRITLLEQQIKSSFSASPTRQRIEKIPGIGPLTATAIMSEIGNGREFKNGRQFAAFLGLVPRHSGSGGRNVNYAISKNGDAYLRTLLIHGARSALRHTAKREDKLGRWCESLKERLGANKAAVALANKNARIIWKMITSEQDFSLAKA